jgi:hypothetical protein
MNWLVSSEECYRLELSTITLWVHPFVDPKMGVRIVNKWVARLDDHSGQVRGRVVTDHCVSVGEAQLAALREAMKLLNRDLAVVEDMVRTLAVATDVIELPPDPMARS